MLIVLGSVKGSPGVTTLAVALAARWPAPALPLVVELDPAGGDLGSRWQLPDTPGLRTLVATAGQQPLTTPAHWSQRLPIAVDVVLGPPGTIAAHTVAAFGDAGPTTLRGLAATRPVLVDAGRLDPASPALDFLGVADLLLVLTRPRLDNLRHLHGALPALSARSRAVHLVVIGDGPYPMSEIGRYLQTPIAATIRHDPAGADIVAGRRRPATGSSRRWLFTAARTLALTLTDADHPPGSASAAAPPPTLAPQWR